MTRELIYLASPYSGPYRLARYRAVCEEAARMFAEGALVYSPIAHTHAIAETGLLPTGFDFWQDFDRRMITACDRVVVLLLSALGTGLWVWSAGQFGRADIFQPAFPYAEEVSA